MGTASQRAPHGRRKGLPTSLEFFGHLRWLDGSPLLDHVEEYRRVLFTQVLDTFDQKGKPAFNLVLAGRAKKNWKSADLVLAALFTMLIRRSPHGNDGFILANDAQQAGDDLSLAKKVIAANPDLGAELEPLADELRLRDGSGMLRVLPAKNVVGQHGKTAAFVGFDEIHGYKDWALLEAMQPDPTRSDALVWITSYASLYNRAGAPLHDLMQIGKVGADRRMLFSWYSGEYCTDPKFADLSPEERANPSMASWTDGPAYLAQQRMRLPFGRFRRLHLNLPGAPEGAAFDQGKVLACIVPGRRSLPPEPEVRYRAFVDMSGGSSDDAVLAIGHRRDRTAVLNLVEKQSGEPPFSPIMAVEKFCRVLQGYGITRVVGDRFAGNTFRSEFEARGITYDGCSFSKSDIYERCEPLINAGEVMLLDDPTLVEQFVTLVWRGGRIDHEAGGHDDFANAVAGLVHVLKVGSAAEIDIGRPILIGREEDAPEIAMPAGARLPESYRMF